MAALRARSQPAAHPGGWPWATGVIVLLALVARLGTDAFALLALERERALSGEVWRLWTAHLVHFSGSHLEWNLAVFIPAGAWAERIAPWFVRGFYVFVPAAIGVVLLVFEPALHVYAGLSGVAAGVLVLLALMQIGTPGRTDRWFWFGVLALIGAKVALEIFSRTPALAQFGSAEIHPVPVAHLAGIACAVAGFFVRRRARASG